VKIADLTYGRGSFYVYGRESLEIHGIDIIKDEWLVKPDLFVHGPFQEKAFELPPNTYDIVVFDPPFPTKPSSRVAENKPWLYRNPYGLETLFKALPKASKHLLKPQGWVIAKIMDAKENGILRLYHTELANVMISEGFKLRDLIIYRMVHRQRPKFPSQLLIQTHSYLLIFQR